MKLSPRSLTLTLAAGALAGVALADDAPAPTTRSEDVRIHKVIVRESGDTAPVPGQSIFLKHRVVTGEEPTTDLTVIDATGASEAFEVGDLAVGETRSVRTASGKSIDVTRTEGGMTLVVDGKTIALPDVTAMPEPGAEGLPSGRHEVRVMKVLASTGTAAEGAEGMEWHAAAPNAVFVGDAMDMASVDFDSLESLKDADPAVRAKVIEALHEILSRPRVLTVDVVGPDAPGTPDAPAAPPATWSRR
jgi:hypothetical protein